MFISRQVLDYNRHYTFQDVNGVPLIYPFDDDFVQNNIVMYLAKGSPFLDPFDDVIAHAMQIGLVGKWYGDDIYRAKLRARNKRHIAADDGYAALSATHFQGAFFLYGIGSVLGLMVFILEIVYHCLSVCNVESK